MIISSEKLSPQHNIITIYLANNIKFIITCVIEGGKIAKARRISRIDGGSLHLNNKDLHSWSKAARILNCYRIEGGIDSINLIIGIDHPGNGLAQSVKGTRQVQHNSSEIGRFSHLKSGGCVWHSQSTACPGTGQAKIYEG